MTQHCKNCGNIAEEKFCSKCGQSTHTERINIHELLHDFMHGVLHVDKGILYTAKELFLRPGNTIHSYLDGKRINHFKPFAYLFLLATMYGFIILLFHLEVSYKHESSVSLSQDINKWIESHYAISMLIMLPFISFCTLLAFRKQRYNYGEHLVLNAYLTGQQIIILIVTAPLFCILDQNLANNIQMPISGIFILYYYLDIFTAYKLKARIIHLVLFLLLCMFVLFVAAVLFAFGWLLTQQILVK